MVGTGGFWQRAMLLPAPGLQPFQEHSVAVTWGHLCGVGPRPLLCPVPARPPHTSEPLSARALLCLSSEPLSGPILPSRTPSPSPRFLFQVPPEQNHHSACRLPETTNHPLSPLSTLLLFQGSPAEHLAHGAAGGVRLPQCLGAVSRKGRHLRKTRRGRFRGARATCLAPR